MRKQIITVYGEHFRPHEATLIQCDGYSALSLKTETIESSNFRPILEIADMLLDEEETK